MLEFVQRNCAVCKEVFFAKLPEVTSLSCFERKNRKPETVCLDCRDKATAAGAEFVTTLNGEAKQI